MAQFPQSKQLEVFSRLGDGGENKDPMHENFLDEN